ncbi:MAG: DUF2225 domain-containing protein, partial [Cyanobacteriota bacterium]|nr:DUF2225 domain-containing protein [Cyanobacteriota bacterium]
MARTRTIFFRAVQSFLKLKNSLRRWISLLLISAFIFSGCLITSRVNAQVPIVKQNQQKLSTSGLVDRGREYYKNKQYNKAIVTWQQALKVYQNNQNNQNQKNTLHQAMVWSYISWGYQKQNNWNQAKEAINKSLDLLPEKNQLDKSKEKLQINAQILNTHASLQLAFGESQKALKTWKKATQIYQQLGDEIGVTGSLINQAQAMEALGLYKRSCTTLLGVFDFDNDKCEISDIQLKEALSLVKKPGNTRLISGLRSLGDNLRLVNELEDSEKLLKGILDIASSNNLYEIKLSLANTERALYRSNQDLYERSDNNNYRDTALYKARNSLNHYDQIIKDSQIESLHSKILAQAKLNRFSLLLEFKEWLQKVPKVNPEVRKEYIKVKEQIKDDI